MVASSGFWTFKSFAVSDTGLQRLDRHLHAHRRKLLLQELHARFARVEVAPQISTLKPLG